MRAYWLSPAIAVARTVSGPSTFRLPLDSAVPGEAVTGSGSPVIRDVSTCERPVTTSTLHGSISPGRTNSRSPTRISSTMISSSVDTPFPTMRCATRGASASRARTASAARPSAYRSSASPPDCISTTTRPASGSISATAATIASVATTSLAKLPRNTPRTVRHTSGAPVSVRPASQTVVDSSGRPDARTARPTTSSDSAMAGSTGTAHRGRGTPAAGCLTTCRSIGTTDAGGSWIVDTWLLCSVEDGEHRARTR